MRIEDGSFNYDQFGEGYSSQQPTDPRVAVYVDKALTGGKHRFEHWRRSRLL